MRLRGASSMKIAEKLGNKAAGVEAKRTVLASTVLYYSIFNSIKAFVPAAFMNYSG
jgi:hypothetical protein